MANNKLFLLEQYDNTGYDTYSSCVVVAKNEDIARLIYPNSKGFKRGDWANQPENVEVTLLGTALKGSEAGVVCSSFHAG